MSLTLIMVLTAAAAASAGYLAARRKGEPRGPEGDDERDAPPDPARVVKPGSVEPKSGKGGGKIEGPKKPAPAKPKQDAFADLPLALGDVVSALEEERWLSGALVAREDGRVTSVLFVAPEGKKTTAVAAFAPPRKDIYWMDPAELSSPEEPPATIELDGIAYRRRGRIPVSMERLGQGAPAVGPEAIWGAYEGGAGEVAVVITSEGKTFAFAGRKLDEDQYDRMGAGE